MLAFVAAGFIFTVSRSAAQSTYTRDHCTFSTSTKNLAGAGCRPSSDVCQTVYLTARGGADEYAVVVANWLQNVRASLASGKR